jgi:hypothetical protein
VRSLQEMVRSCFNIFRPLDENIPSSTPIKRAASSTPKKRSLLSDQAEASW